MKDAIRKGTAENEVQKHEKRDLEVLGDKWAHAGSDHDMKDGVKVMT